MRDGIPITDNANEILILVMWKVDVRQKSCELPFFSCETSFSFFFLPLRLSLFE